MHHESEGEIIKRTQVSDKNPLVALQAKGTLCFKVIRSLWTGAHEMERKKLRWNGMGRNGKPWPGLPCPALEKMKRSLGSRE